MANAPEVKPDFYRTNNRYGADRSISKALERGQITPGDAEIITRYTTERQARAGISAVRAVPFRERTHSTLL